MLRVDVKSRTVNLAKVFKWYANDFGCTIEEVSEVPHKSSLAMSAQHMMKWLQVIEWILWVMEKSSSQKRTNLQEVHHNGEFEVEYIPYDWTFNGQMCEKK